MADKNDINSTEKLLNAIRGKQKEADDAVGKIEVLPSNKLPAQQKDKKISGIFPDKKIYTVGVDIGHDCIHLVKTIKASEDNPILVDQKNIEYDENLAKESPEFRSLLKASLLSICGNPANCNIWAMTAADEVNIQNVKVPPVQKKQMENAIYWAAKKELSFDEKDYIFDFELQEDIIDQGLPKRSVMVYTVPKAEVEKTRALYSGIGITLTGITLAPFVIQNIFRTNWMPANEGTTATLFIGNEFSRINIYSRNNLMMTRGIKTGTSSMLEAITEAFGEKRKIKLEKDDAKKILLSLVADAAKARETEAGFGLKTQEIFNMIIPAIERLVRQMERTLQYYATSTGHEKVEKIYISSVMNIYKPIIDYISDQLGVKSEVFDPFQYQDTSQGTGSISLTDRMALVPALGLSFSDNQRTPNLIFTYKEENKEITLGWINRGIVTASLVAGVICILTIIYQGMNVIALSKQKETLKRELSVIYNPEISADKVTKMINDAKTQKQISRQYAQRYLSMAVIGEISALTPQNIKLINMTIISSRSTVIAVKTDKAAKESEGITLEGIITGERSMLDSYLAQYIMKLSNSPMLHKVSVYKNSIVTFKNNNVLQFTMSAKIGK